MRELRSSIDLRSDGAALRDRLREDGYLYLPGLIESTRLLELRTEILRTIAGHGWTEADTDPADAIPSSPRRYHTGESWTEGYVIQRLESFHRQAFDPDVLDVMRTLYDDEQIRVHGQRIARVIWPDAELTTQPHQDYTNIQGAPTFVTTWVPLSDCPPDLGGLRLLVGSHADGLQQVLPSDDGLGTGNIRSTVDDHDPRWATADWKLGDLVLFDSLTVHGALPNTSGRLRLSVDYRYQRARDPIAWPSMQPHNAPYVVPPWDELLDGTGWASYEWVEECRSLPESEFADFLLPTSFDTWHEDLAPVLAAGPRW